jgi:hypothetical protein
MQLASLAMNNISIQKDDSSESGTNTLLPRIPEAIEHVVSEQFDTTYVRHLSFQQYF